MPTITFDGPNKIIEIGYDSSTTTVTAPDIYSRWKDWVKAGNAQYFEAFSQSVGGNDLGGGASLDGYYFIRNDLGWRIRAADQDYELVIDGQLFGFAPATAVYLPRVGRTITYRFVLSSRSQVVNASGDLVSAATGFQGAVYLNPNSAYAGTDYPNGTSVQPVNNWVDAVAIANVYGLRNIILQDDLPLVGVDVTGFDIKAQNTSIALYIDASATVSDTTFEQMAVTGTCDGHAAFNNCGIAAMTGVHGNFVNCVLTPGGLQLNGDTVFLNCASGIPGDGTPDVDYMGGAYEVQFRGYYGSVRLNNLTAGSTTSVDMDSGRLILAANCTGGEVKLRGLGEPAVDLSGGVVNVDKDGFVVAGEIVAAIAGGVEAVRYGEYVIVDANSANAGTDYPNGTLEAPVNNVTDANAIAAARGISHLRFLSDHTFVSGDNVSLKTLCSNSPGLVTLTFEPGAITEGTVFEDVTVEGILVSPSAFKRCVLGDITGNTIGQVGLVQAIETTFTGVVTLSSSLAGTIELLDCTTSSNAATFDINGADVNVYLHRHSGDVTVQGFSRAGKIIHIQLFAGDIVLESTCTDGTIEIHGGAELNDQSNGTTVIDLTENTDRANKRDETINKVAANIWAAS